MVVCTTDNVALSILVTSLQVGKGSGSPYKYPETTADYIVKWITGAKATYKLDIDYVGVSP